MAKTIANVLTGVATLYFKYPIGGSYVEVGYTEDGVQLEYNADTADIEVEETTFPIDRVITKESLSIKCNMAESSLANIDKAIAGSVLSGSTITIGGGVMKDMSIQIVGTNPAGFARTITIALANAVGAVGIAYRKGAKTVVPVTFQALKGTSDVCTIVDSAS
jgi:hypothetical protein